MDYKKYIKEHPIQIGFISNFLLLYIIEVIKIYDKEMTFLKVLLDSLLNFILHLSYYDLIFLPFILFWIYKTYSKKLTSEQRIFLKIYNELKEKGLLDDLEDLFEDIKLDRPIYQDSKYNLDYYRLKDLIWQTNSMIDPKTNKTLLTIQTKEIGRSVIRYKQYGELPNI